LVTKGPDAFRTISEAADELGMPQHVLRFWETRFSFIRPMKRAGGRRFYRPHDIDILRGVRTLLHDEGYTIKGVQRLHRERGIGRVLNAAQGTPPADGDAADEAQVRRDLPLTHLGPETLTAADRGRLSDALDELVAAKTQLDRLLRVS
jgi:DNA-binding transcriptional MerR regulator